MLVEFATGIFVFIILRALICVISPWIDVAPSFKQRNTIKAAFIHNIAQKRKSKSDSRKRKSKRKASYKGAECNKASSTRSTLGLESSNETGSVSKVTFPGAGNTAVGEPASTIHQPPNNLQKLDNDANNRTIFKTDKARESFSFTLDQYGGVVESPFCQLIFLYGAVLRPIKITVEPSYQWMHSKEDNAKICMTPEIHFTSDDEMKFLRPVEVQLQTPYSATRKKESLSVEIERTEHCIPLNWLKIRDLKFHKGMIKFFCNQFCGIRAVCSSSQRQSMSTRLSYSLSVQDSHNLPEWQKMVYFRVYTDIPDTHQQIQHEMEEDGYRRIHPTQHFTLKHGYDLMVMLKSRGLQTSPPYEIVTVDADVISQAYVFTLETDNNQPIAGSSISIDANLAEISPFKTSRIYYSLNPSRREPRNVNITVNSGTGIQNNYTMCQTAHENGSSISEAHAIHTVMNTHQTAQPQLPRQPEFPNIPPQQTTTIYSPQSIPVHPSLQRPGRVFTVEEVNEKEANETKPMRTWAMPQVVQMPTYNQLGCTSLEETSATIPKAHPMESYTQIQNGQNSFQIGTFPTPHHSIQPVQTSIPSLAVSNLENQYNTTPILQQQILPSASSTTSTTTTLTAPSQLGAEETTLTRHGSLHQLEEISGHTISQRKHRSISISEDNMHLEPEQSHPRYTQTITRSAFKSAFSSYPLVIKHLWDSQKQLNARENEEKQNESRQEEMSLAMLLEAEDKDMLNPESNGGYCDELFEIFADTPNKNPSGEVRPPQTRPQTADRASERPPSMSSGFVSGISTRNTSVNAEVNFSTIEKQLDEKDESKDVIPVMPRPRSISDPAKTSDAAKKSGPSSQESNQAPQISKHKKSYSEVVKIQSTGFSTTSTPKQATRKPATRRKPQTFSTKRKVLTRAPWIP